MNFLEPLKIKNIDLDKLIYSKIKYKQNYKIILFKYNKNNFVFQTQKLLNINSINNFDNDLLISLNDNSTGSIELNNLIEKLEEKIKNDINNNLSWFNDIDNNNIIYQRLIRDNNCIKIKFIKNNKLNTILQLNNKIVDNININSQSYCKLILECYGIWINSNNNFGIYLRPINVSIIKDINKYNYDFINDSDSSSISHEEIDLDIVDSYHNDKDNNVENNDFFKKINLTILDSDDTS